MAPGVLLLDDPLPGVRRLTLNRPDKRNALSNELRGTILTALKEADADPAVKVSIMRGAGPCFSSGYDLAADNSVGQPFYSPGGPGQWARHVVESWFTVWDLAKPVVAQVHGYCLAGGSELAACCDLVYVAEGSLLAVRFDLSRMETVGAVSEVLPRSVLGNPPMFDVSPNGTLIYGDRDSVGHPGQVFLTRRDALGGAATLLGENLPLQPTHASYSFPGMNRTNRSSSQMCSEPVECGPQRGRGRQSKRFRSH